MNLQNPEHRAQGLTQAVKDIWHQQLWVDLEDAQHQWAAGHRLCSAH